MDFQPTFITNSIGKVAFISSGGSSDPTVADKDFSDIIIPKIEELL